MTSRNTILKELGLSPQWRLAGDDNKPAPVAVTKPKPNPSPPPSPSSSPKSKPVTTTSSPPPQKFAPEPGVAVELIAKMDWPQLYKTVRECRKCELCARRKQAVFGVGDTEADIMFVGEGPGADEDRKGEPFVGAAGMLLDKMLAAIGLSRKEGVYIANIVKCRPPANRTPKSDEAASCLPYLHRQIELVRPKLIVALGRVAAAHLLEDAPISRLRQSMREYQGIPVVVSYHPAYLLRSPQDKRKAWDDLRLIKKIAAGD